MVDILHRVGIESPASDVYAALTTTEGLAGWWTTDTRGKGAEVGDVLEFRFGAGGFDMRVRELEPGKHVLWEVIDGPDDWVGTQLDWNLGRADGQTIVLFKHQGWKEPVEAMYHCSTKWAVFLLSLKSLIETGKGAPEPYDVKIDNWN
ncbi:SRPBCC family protein [Nocardia barduliensis]|uniref:SRPBCC family protein n=1 Tax=Nocardia barduliensis TaxID=2736643 RepID=UPI001573FCAA|nr:SRPBCC domain-containing protein [Nocardia barduliensis]